ncbi:hypothetical protein lerEdw1_014336 [Lerista edwardsae]|nr:hypothetical protein lerEdw1_014338 [Lerista edwardsae]KAJ6633661.1 hypothetical protein lerEdw1_014336 [Lerista edwardsae]
MKVWLITLGLTLLCSVFAVEDVGQVTGTWHNIAIASDCKCLMKHQDKMKMTVVNLVAENPGSITMETRIPMPGGCKNIKMEFTKQDNGHYFHTCEWGDKTIQEVDTTHKDVLLVKAIHEKKGKTCTVRSILARERTVNPEVIDDFVQKAKADGLKSEHIKIMPTEVACIESQ